MDSFEVTCGLAFIEDLWLFISTPLVWMYNGTSIYMEWLGSPYYFTTNGSMEGSYSPVPDDPCQSGFSILYSTCSEPYDHPDY